MRHARLLWPALFTLQQSRCLSSTRVPHCVIPSLLWSSSTSSGQKTFHRISLPAKPDSFTPIMDLEAVVRRLKDAQWKSEEPVSSKEAAVLIPIFQDASGDVRVILTQRSASLRTHQGEVALPGGKKDPEDSTCVDTALREAQEEMGLDPSSVEIITRMPPVLSKHYLSVTPVIGVVKHDISEVLHPNPGEVDAIFDMPLRMFLEEDARHSVRDFKMSGFKYRVHYFQYGEFDVWGLTAGILIGAAQAAFGRAAEFDVVGPGIDYTRLCYDGAAVRLRDTL